MEAASAFDTSYYAKRQQRRNWFFTFASLGFAFPLFPAFLLLTITASYLLLTIIGPLASLIFGPPSFSSTYASAIIIPFLTIATASATALLALYWKNGIAQIINELRRAKKLHWSVSLLFALGFLSQLYLIFASGILTGLFAGSVAESIFSALVLTVGLIPTAAAAFVWVYENARLFQKYMIGFKAWISSIGDVPHKFSIGSALKTLLAVMFISGSILVACSAIFGMPIMMFIPLPFFLGTSGGGSLIALTVPNIIALTIANIVSLPWFISGFDKALAQMSALLSGENLWANFKNISFQLAISALFCFSWSVGITFSFCHSPTYTTDLVELFLPLSAAYMYCFATKLSPPVVKQEAAYARFPKLDFGDSQSPSSGSDADDERDPQHDLLKDDESLVPMEKSISPRFNALGS